MNAEQTVQILCIEDNPINWRLVQRLLDQAGFEAHWANEGFQGFDMALALKPDLILLDINLPGLSGFEVATKFRQHPELKAIPLVALTAKTLRGDRERALVAGCEGFIAKPIDPFAFVDQVKGYLKGQRDYVAAIREGSALRSLNAQVVEHLEAQLRALEETNAKLVATQEDLEHRNQSLGRLFHLSQGILTEPDAPNLLTRILEAVRGELRASTLHAYRSHESGAYMQGVRWKGGNEEAAPILPSDARFPLMVSVLPKGVALHGETLRANRLWEDGVELGFWSRSEEACMILLQDAQASEARLGIWIFARPEPFQSFELDMLAMFASMALVVMENAELVSSLTESSRALALSYENMELAYQELQRAKADLGRQERRSLMDHLFMKIVQRLRAPVDSLHQHRARLAELLVGAPPEALSTLAEIAHAEGRVDGLLKALSRRVFRDQPNQPEWIDLKETLQNEMELLQTEGVLSDELAITVDDHGEYCHIFGVYGDFSRILQFVFQHAVGGPNPTGTLAIRAWREDHQCHLEVLDEGGAIPPMALATAFEPFSGLHQDAIVGVRSPGEGLVQVRQLLEAYDGRVSIQNIADGTVVRVVLPIQDPGATGR